MTIPFALPTGESRFTTPKFRKPNAPVAYLIRFEGRTARCIQFDGTVVRRHGCVIVTANRGHCEGTAVLILSIRQIVSASNRVGADAIVRPASEASVLTPEFSTPLNKFLNGSLFNCELFQHRAQRPQHVISRCNFQYKFHQTIGSELGSTLARDKMGQLLRVHRSI